MESNDNDNNLELGDNEENVNDSRAHPENKSKIKFDTNKGIEHSRILFESEKDKEELPKYSCKFCQLVPMSPETCPRCGQIFCSTCIAEYISDGNHNCPNCSVVYKKSDLPQRVIDFLDKMLISCKFEPFGCEAALRFDGLPKHEFICKETFKECPQCMENHPYKNYTNHVDNCKMKIIQCEDCDYRDNNKNMEKTDKLMQHIHHKLMNNVKLFFRDEMNNLKIELKTYIDERLGNVQPQYTGNITQSISNTGTNNTEDRVLKIMFRQNICDNGDNNYQLDNKFCVLKSSLGENLVVWGNNSYSIEAFDLELGKVTHCVKKAHDSNINCLSHCEDQINKVNYILTASFDRSLKVWSVEEKFKNILTISEAHFDYSIFSAQILYNYQDNNIYLISSNFNERLCKIWECNFENNQAIWKKSLHEVGKVKFVTTWFDASDQGKYYVILANDKEILSYELMKDEPYHSYTSDQPTSHTSAVVNENGQLIESDCNGIIRVWSFHSGELLKTIVRSSAKIRITGIALWSPNLILAASNDKTILLFDMGDEKHIRSFTDHKSEVYCVKVFNHPMYGKAFFSFGFDSKIKLWY